MEFDKEPNDIQTPKWTRGRIFRITGILLLTVLGIIPCIFGIFGIFLYRATDYLKVIPVCTLSLGIPWIIIGITLLCIGSLPEKILGRRQDESFSNKLIIINIIFLPLSIFWFVLIVNAVGENEGGDPTAFLCFGTSIGAFVIGALTVLFAIIALVYVGNIRSIIVKIVNIGFAAINILLGSLILFLGAWGIGASIAAF